VSRETYSTEQRSDDSRESQGALGKFQLLFVLSPRPHSGVLFAMTSLHCFKLWHHNREYGQEGRKEGAFTFTRVSYAQHQSWKAFSLRY